MFWLLWVFIALHGLPLVAATGGYSPAAVRGRLTAVASLVAEHRLLPRVLRLQLCGMWAQVLWLPGPRAQAHSCCEQA